MRVTGIVATLFCCWSELAVAQASPPPQRGIALELNRLEAVGSSCRGYFVARNNFDRVTEVRLDVFLFDRQGIILRRVGLTFPDLPAQRTKVVLFDLADAPCSELGRLLVNEVIGCTSAGGQPVNECPNSIVTSSRANIEFGY